MKNINKFFNIEKINKYNSVIKKVKTKDGIDKKIATGTGRVYIHGNRLNVENTLFTPGAKYNIYPNKNKDSIAIVASKDGEYTVSRRINEKTGKITPILDVKSEMVKEMFKGYEIDLTIYGDCIISKKTNKKVEANKKSKLDKTVSSISNKASKIINLFGYKKKKEENVVDINVDEYNHKVFLKKASGGTFDFAQLSMFDSIFSSVSSAESVSTQYNYPFSREAKEIAIKKTFKPISLASFFCGMGGLDYAFKVFREDNQKVFDEIFALDKSFHKETKENIEKYGKENCSVLEDYHIQTFKKNVGDCIVSADFLTYPIEDIPDFEVGTFTIPCVELSSVSPSRNKFSMLPKFVDRFIEIMKAKKDKCKVFVIENSINMLSAGREFIDKIKRELPWFEVSENGVDAADFGAAQHRERAILIGSTIGRIELKKPVLKMVKTVRQAFEGLNDSIPNQLDYSKAKEDTQFRMSFVKQGGNWQDVPEEYRKKGKFANYMRRLHLDEVSIAIANIRKSLITHPTENRVISVRECLRIFGLPDKFIPVGTLAAMQQMVANSVPMELSSAIADTISKAFIKYRNSNDLNLANA